RQQHPEACIIAADTVVVIDGLVLGKPADRGAAEQMLHRLSGRVHTVYTGMVVLCGAQARRSVTATQVEFYPLTPAEITRYIDSGAPFDKAGGYGIQDGGCVFVKGINGDWYNVMGLPVAVLYRELSALNVACL
ncbi:MAG: Maf family protein, partial [Angelakisella sp.]